MARRGRLRDLAARLHLPRRTVRLRLTALYCALFLPLGVALVVITFVLTVLSLHPAATHPIVHVQTHGHGRPVVHPPAANAGAGGASPPNDVHIGSLDLDVDQFLLGACITVVALIVATLLLGWLVAGRVLRPLRTITDSARSISEHDLHQRLALSGPRDELSELGDTIDGLLGRLERAFESQRRFVANASHELRTPLAVDRAVLQVALSDPDLTLSSLRRACAEVLESGRAQERLIDALLTLARSQRGLERREPVDLAAAVREIVDQSEPAASARGVQIDSAVAEAVVFGDVQLLGSLVSNLVDNAIRYNVAGGLVEVTLTASVTEVRLIVTNTGPPVRPDQLARLLQPFQRGTSNRTAGVDGVGLGLSVVANITGAHGAGLDLRPRSDGGLTITVSFTADQALGATPRRPAEHEAQTDSEAK